MIETLPLVHPGQPMAQPSQHMLSRMQIELCLGLQLLSHPTHNNPSNPWRAALQRLTVLWRIYVSCTICTFAIINLVFTSSLFLLAVGDLCRFMPF
jgi:hypothetical protein